MRWTFLSLVSFFTFFSVVAVSAPRPSSMNAADLKAELTGKDYKKLSEDDLYVEILSRYQRNSIHDMKGAAQYFLGRYPSSVHADNVLYLMGYNALERKKYSEALRHFDLLLKKYPLSSKAVSAEFAKGTAYKQMKIPKLAQNSFLKVRKKYPGSPEFFRAESEIKLLLVK